MSGRRKYMREYMRDYRQGIKRRKDLDLEILKELQDIKKILKIGVSI